MIPLHKNKAVLLLLLAMVGALSPTVAQAMETPERDKPSGPVWVIGDSIGVGIAGAMKRSGWYVVSLAKNGTNARQWRARLSESPGELPDAPRVVVVSLGTNDAVSAELRREFRANARAIMGQLLKDGHCVIWVLPPSPVSRIPAGNDLEVLIGLGGYWVHRTDLPMADQWHPTAAGYDELAARAMRIAQEAH